MARIFVEGWSPEYGAPLDQDEALAPTRGSVDPAVELKDWEPLEGADDGIERIAQGCARIDGHVGRGQAVELSQPDVTNADE